MPQVNVLAINGWGGSITSQSIAHLRNDILKVFGREIYFPPPVNHNETGLILRYLEKWKDAQILVGLSCGCSTINEIAKYVKPKGERIPFAMYFSPSIYCGITTRPVLPVIERAQEVNSWGLDFFNPGGGQCIKRSADNKSTVMLPRIKSGLGHGFTPQSAAARMSLVNEIKRALA